jgi:hypothetical protein
MQTAAVAALVLQEACWALSRALRRQMRQRQQQPWQQLRLLECLLAV